MHFKELEFKYDASEVGWKSFETLVSSFKPNNWLKVSSYDDYFSNKDGGFIRYRHREGRGELTIKKKTVDKNNNERIEVNIPTDGNSLVAVTAFVELLGYVPNFNIYKTCNIAFLDKAVLVYYVVYDEEMKEKRRFIEIEANEEYSWQSEQEAWDEVIRYEKLLEPLGITPKNRLKKSLFEMFKKDSVNHP